MCLPPKPIRDYDAMELVGRKLLESQLGADRELHYGAASTAITRGFRSPMRTAARTRTPERPSTPRLGCSKRTVSPSPGALPPTVLTRPRHSLLYTAPFGLNVGVFQLGRQRAAGEPLCAAGYPHLCVLRRPGQRRPHTDAVADRRQRAIRAGPWTAKERDPRAQRAQPVQPGPGRVAVQLETNQGVRVAIDAADYYAGRADVSAAFDQQHWRAIHDSCNTSSFRSPSRRE